MGCRPVDYDLVDYLERKRAAEERGYVCPHLPWLRDAKDMYLAQGWWRRHPLYPGPGNGLVWRLRTGVRGETGATHVDSCSGEMNWF